MTPSVSTVECSQLIPSAQTSEFKVILDQRVQAWTTFLAANYEQLRAEITELCLLVIEIRSWISGTCAPFYAPQGSSEDPLPPLSPPTPLF
jgi:hypothetical protein